MTTAMIPCPAQVETVRQETHDTYTLDLRPDTPIAFAPGQFNMLYVFGAGEAPISMSGNPETHDRVIHTIRAVGGVTNALCRLQPGDAVGLRGPFGTPWPLLEAQHQDVLLVAGGIGLAPLRPVLYALFHHRNDFGKITLLYGARHPQDLLFFTELQQWGDRFDVNVGVTVDQAPKQWRGRVGVVTSLFDRVDFSSAPIVMICGPEIMMRFALRTLHRRGVPSDRVYVSMERNMHCAIGLCGHCQFGADFVCKDGPVFRFDRLENRFATPEV